jgi:hypothetical protein
MVVSKIIWHDLNLPAINLWSLPMATYNGVTGDALVTKVGNKEQQQKYADNYDRIFKKEPTERNPDPDWDEGRIDVIGQNDCMHYGWHKHDGSLECPVDKEAMVEVETWTPTKIIQKAYVLHWKSVKFYRVIDNV